METSEIYEKITSEKYKDFVLTHEDKVVFLMDKAKENKEFSALLKEIASQPMTLLYSDEERFIQYKMQKEKYPEKNHFPAKYVNKTYSDINEEAIDVLYGNILWANLKGSWVTLIFNAMGKNVKEN